MSGESVELAVWTSVADTSMWCHVQVVKLKHFQKFENTTDALAAASALVDSKLSKGLYPNVALYLASHVQFVLVFLRPDAYSLT